MSHSCEVRNPLRLAVLSVCFLAVPARFCLLSLSHWILRIFRLPSNFVVPLLQLRLWQIRPIWQEPYLCLCCVSKQNFSRGIYWIWSSSELLSSIKNARNVTSPPCCNNWQRRGRCWRRQRKEEREGEGEGGERER